MKTTTKCVNKNICKFTNLC